MQPISNGLAISFTTGLHRGCTKFYAKKDSGIKEPKDLKGKTVGIPNLTAPLLLRGEKLDEAKLTQLLERLELAHLKQAYPEQLSAGEYRRVCLARTLALEPEVLVADEPTSNLDAGNAQKVRGILEEVKKSEVSLIVVTHDAKMQFEPVLSLE